MRRMCLFISIVVLGMMMDAQAASTLREIPLEEVQAAFGKPVAPHPRLFITDAQLAEIQSRIESQAPLRVFYQAMVKKAEGILEQEPRRAHPLCLLL